MNPRLKDRLPEPLDREALFDAMLDECYDLIAVGGPFAFLTPSRVLKECDPTAYRCGVNDYIDSLGAVEYEGEEYDDADFADAVREALDEIDDEIEDLEAERDELEDERDFAGVTRLEELRAEADELEGLL